MATWSISVNIIATSCPECRGLSGSRARSAEDGDLVLADAGPLLGVVDAETLARCQAQHADLALVLVAVDRPRGDADLGQRVHRREQGLAAALVAEAVGGVGLGVVG